MLLKRILSHIQDYILRDNPNSACFPSFGYQSIRADKQERLPCPGVTFVRHVILESAELYCVTLCALYGRIALFGYES